MFKQHWHAAGCAAGWQAHPGPAARPPPLRPSVCRPPAARAWLLGAPKTEGNIPCVLGSSLGFRVWGVHRALGVDVSDHSPSGLTPPRTARGEASAANLRAKPQARFLLSLTHLRFAPPKLQAFRV